MAADGRPVSGARLETYTSGTSTPKAVYSDSALTVPHANPVIADSAGRFAAMYLAGGDYRVILTDADSAVIATYDPVEGGDDAGAAAATASMRNRIINAGMQVSQERGSATISCTTGNTYIMDGWVAVLSATPGGTAVFGQVFSITPGGSPTRLRLSVSVADGTIAAGNFYAIAQQIEGLRIADARFGSASARHLLLRFGVRSSVAGTAGVFVRNSAGNRAWLGTITIAPSEVGTDVVKTLTIPGDTSGTWLTTSGIGMTVGVCLAAGTTYQGVAGWQAGDLLTTSSQSNFMGTGAATFDLFDVGLYVDASAAGTFPIWELPDFSEEMTAAQRYWEASYNYGVGPSTVTAAGASVGPTQSGGAGAALIMVTFATRKRATPTVLVYDTSTGTVGQMNDGGAVTSAATVSAAGESGLVATNAGALTADIACAMHWVADARL